MSLRERIITKAAAAFTRINPRVMPEGTRCFLLKRGESSGRLVSVKELTAGWFVESSEYRGQMVLSYATLESGFNDEIAQTSFVAYGVPDAQGQMEVFGIDPDRRDVVPPNGTSPFWKVYISKLPEERFTVPTL